MLNVIFILYIYEYIIYIYIYIISPYFIYIWTCPGGSTPKKQQLYDHLPPITKTIQVRRTRHAGYCWKIRDELIRDVLLWTPSHGRAKSGRPAQAYIQQLSANMGCRPEDLPEAMDDRQGWREGVRDIRADSLT